MIDVWEAKQVELRPFVGGKGSADSDNRKLVRRYVRAGRALLHDEGAIPWALWTSGDLPREWWQETLFVGAINLWYTVYVERNREELALVRGSISVATEYARAFKALSDAIQKRENENSR